MKVTFLGTGTSQGVPVIGSSHPVCLSDDSKDKRLRVSVLIEYQGQNIVIDCGPDFRQQMLNSKCEKIDAILFTHEHADHTMGLDDIRPFSFKQGHVNLYAHQRVFDSLSKRFDYIFVTENKYPGAPNVVANEIKNEVFKVNGIKILPVEGLHYKLPVFGFRIENFCYLTDMKTISETEKQKLKDLDVLVINALRIEEHISHFNLKQALKLINELKPKQAYLTHISHLMGFHKQVDAKLPLNVSLAYDNLQIEL